MASVVNDPDGRKRIQFFGRDGRRQTVRLGVMTKKAAQGVCLRIEHLLQAQMSGQALDPETGRWVSDLGDVLAERLAAVGLIPARESSRLGPWLDKYLASRTDLKPSSRTKLAQTKAKLLAYFDAGTSLREITANDAADWRQSLIAAGVSKATVKTHIGNAKTVFNAAVDRELIPRSPFEKLKGGATASSNDRYVTPDETRKLLDAATDLRYRVLIALARYAGLRTPSETHLLTWADVDWERGRLTVRSPKTEHHLGKEQRLVPITPELAAILQDAFDAALPGEERVVALGRGGNIRRVVERIVRQSGVEPWPDLWQTLRRSCEKEWAMRFPQYAVSRWIGHSITVSGKHYANAVPDELFQKAAATPAQTAQNPAQYPSAEGRTRSHAENPEEAESAFFGSERGYADACDTEQKVSEGIRSPQSASVTGYDSNDLQQRQAAGGAESGAACERRETGGQSESQFEPELQILIDYWRQLPPGRAAAMLSILRSSAGPARPSERCEGIVEQNKASG